VETLPVEVTTEATVPETTQSSYEVSLGIGATSNGRVEVKETELVIEESTSQVVVESKWNLGLNIFNKTGVPDKSVDGRSWTGYLSNVTLADFGTFWGSKLTEEDKFSNSKVLVGVSQDPMDFEKGDLQSVGWLIENLSILAPETAVKFTNLHVIGSLSSSHTAVLCSYDWYSAFGLKDVLVVFEDMSGTVEYETLTAGDEFSIIIFAHNIKVKKVRGYNVVMLQYRVFE